MATCFARKVNGDPRGLARGGLGSIFENQSASFALGGRGIRVPRGIFVDFAAKTGYEASHRHLEIGFVPRATELGLVESAGRRWRQVTGPVRRR